MLVPMLLAAGLFCLFVWPAVAGILKVLGFCDDWPSAFRAGAGVGLILWLVAAVDLVTRWWKGKPLEPDGDE